MVGVGVEVEHARAAGGEGGADGVDRRGVAALGDVGDGEQHASEHEAPAVEDRRPVDVQRRLGTTTSRWTARRRPADRRARAEGDVGGAEDLLVLEDVAGQLRALVRADAELGDVGARSPVRGSCSTRRSPSAPAARPGRRPHGEVRRRRRPGRYEASERRDRALAPGRRDEALAAGQVPEGARRGEVAVVGDPRAPAGRGEVGAARAGDVRLVGRVSRAATAWLRARRRSKSTAISRASMSAVTAGMVAPRAPASLAALRAACARASATWAR